MLCFNSSGEEQSGRFSVVRLSSFGTTLRSGEPGETAMTDQPVVEKHVVEEPRVVHHTVHDEPRVIHDTVHDVEHDNGSPNWAVGLLLGALAAWQFQDKFGGELAIALPWLLAGAVLLGAAALVESITSEVWVTLIGGVFVLAAAFIITGRANVQRGAF